MKLGQSIGEGRSEEDCRSDGGVTLMELWETIKARIPDWERGSGQASKLCFIETVNYVPIEVSYCLAIGLCYTLPK